MGKVELCRCYKEVPFANHSGIHVKRGLVKDLEQPHSDPSAPNPQAENPGFNNNIGLSYYQNNNNYIYIYICRVLMGLGLRL